MLGTDLVATLERRGHAVTPATRATANLTKPDEVRELVAGHDVVANCVAWTAVDDAETHEAQALTANGLIPDVLAREVARSGGRMVQVSTD
jgi:dTDP-4-dehydrorhamnose reductase